MVAEGPRNFRPYAASANVLAVLARVRSRNLPERLDYNFLRTVGIADVVFGRVMQTLRFLDFVNEEGFPTDRLTAYAAAPDPRQILADAVREAYREDFANTDPTEDGQEIILRAFQQYQPRSQTTRMVMLFLGLCREAGIPVKDAPRERKMQPATRKRDGRTQGTPKASTVSHARLPESQQVFGITEDDIAILDEQEFNELWAAIGKVVRKKARAGQQPAEEPTEQETEEPLES